MSKLTKDSCRRCGRNTHATIRCPNVVTPPVVTLPISTAAQIAADAAKRAAEAAKRAAEAAERAAAKQAQRDAEETQRAVKVAVFESLEPFGVEVRNRSCFRASNWDTESFNLCERCGKEEPKNGCWCMPHK